MKQDIIRKFEELLRENDMEKLPEEIESLEEAYEKASTEREQELHRQFVAEGNKTEDFNMPDEPEDHRFKELMNIYEDKHQKWEEERVSEKEQNLKAKQEIIDELKKLISEEESISTAFQRFNELRAKWKTIGHVPSHKYRETQTEYSHQIDLFFYTINIYKDLKELDLKKNLEQKQDLVKQMKELVKEKSIRKTDDHVKALQEEWYEIGPVPHHEWESLRDEFRKATHDVYSKIQAHYDKLREKQQENLKAKQEIVHKMKSISGSEYNSHKKWQEKTEQVLQMQNDWKKIGFAPKEKNEEVWQEFRSACDTFFSNKQAYYDKWKKEKEENKQQKEELIRQAEAVKDSTDWKHTSDELIRLQKQWTSVGATGRKEEQELWKQFRAACDHFFNAKKTYFENIDEIHQENLKKKEAFLQRVNEDALSGNVKDDLKVLKGFVKEWNELGHVPKKDMDRINSAFKEALDKKYDKLKLNKDERTTIKYKNKLERLQQSGDSDKLLYRERKFIEQNIYKLEETIKQYEHNMNFFNVSKNAAPLMKEVEEKLEQSKTELENLRKRLKLLKAETQ